MASLQTLHPTVMIILLSVFLLAVGLVITDEMSEAVADKFTGECELQNITWKNVTLVGSTEKIYQPLLSEITVTCSGVTLNQADYRVGATSTLEINYTASPSTYNNTNCTVKGYSYTDRAAFTAVNTTSEAMSNITDWLPILIIVIMTAIILGIVIRGFAGSTSM